jgi:thiosulfate dehydrogenase
VVALFLCPFPASEQPLDLFLNTHPETYPKFQKQIGSVATLRDMINWCIENPLEGEPMELDDPKMIALEAYITRERRGVPLDPGKH